MKATGIVRNLDDLGRVVIPKDIRRTMGIRAGSPLEIFVDEENGGLVLVPYCSGSSTKIYAVAENISGLGSTPEHWEIANKLRELAKALEKLDEEND